MLLPRLIAWELTRRCDLQCRHCRAGADKTGDTNELDTAECLQILDRIAVFAQPIIILTGGEPLLRADVYEIAQYGRELGLRMVLASCGTAIDEAVVEKMQKAGIAGISISLDGANAASHDGFRGVEGAFEAAVAATAAARKRGLRFQINTTVAASNLDELGEIMRLAQRLGAATFNVFGLVPTGRGKELLDEQITAEQYEQMLRWLSEQEDNNQMKVRVTCAPHYQRIVRQRKDTGGGLGSEKGPIGGCMGGKTFAFISHVGTVQICGFLDVGAGDLRASDYDFAAIWRDAEVFRAVRDVDGYHGKCGGCEYRRVCGGCRARAYALTGDYLASEPLCAYEPKQQL